MATSVASTPKPAAAPSDPAAPAVPPATTPTMGGRRRGLAGSWMAHVKATMRAHKGLKLKQVLKLAKKTYKKAKRGGGVTLTPAEAGGSVQSGGRHRRGHGKTRRSRRGGNMMGEY